MDAQSIETLKATLDAELARLEAEVAQIDDGQRVTLSEMSGENAYRDHMADQGSATFEREMDMTLEENLRTELQDVRDALTRVAEGSYGTCVRCAAHIPVERLEAVPTARLCIKCKEAEEAR